MNSLYTEYGISKKKNEKLTQIQVNTFTTLYFCFLIENEGRK